MKQLVLDISPPTPATLDSFVVGRNAELVQLLRDLPAAPVQERFVYIWGEPGSGKSHLLEAYTRQAAERGCEAAYVEAADAHETLADLSDSHVVALDDVQQLDGTTQIALFNLYNRLREGNGMLLVSGDAAAAQLSLRQDLVTRLGWGLVYQVHALSDADKVQALKTHARRRGFDLADAVAEYLLRHWRRDLPALLAVLDALDRYSLETKRPITVPLLRDILRAPE
jgi:DnaA family protein